MASTFQKIADKLTGKDKNVDNTGGANYGNTHTSHTHPTSGVTGATTHHTTGATTATGDNYQSSTAGPHSSNLANKLDPRVDSDRDGYQNATSQSGGYGPAHHATTSHQGSTTGSAFNPGMTTAGSNDPRSTNVGPHSSNLANKFDPRVDSDADGRSHYASGQSQGTGFSQGYSGHDTSMNHSQSTNTAPHSSNLLNKLDPRVDTDRAGNATSTSHTSGYDDGYGGTHQHAGHNASTHQNTHPSTTYANTGSQGYNAAYEQPQSGSTGPHSSNLLNKLDPRVDNAGDGRSNPSSHAGGYGQSTHNSGGVGRY